MTSGSDKTWADDERLIVEFESRCSASAEVFGPIWLDRDATLLEIGPALLPLGAKIRPDQPVPGIALVRPSAFASESNHLKRLSCWLRLR
jgi:hypothetical protein